MSKLSAFLTQIVPIFIFLGVVQIFLLGVNPEKRRKFNFAILALLAFSSIRPNILGETFGIIGPLYLFLLVRISKQLKPDYQPLEKSASRLRNLLFSMFSLTFFYWIFVLTVSSFRTYPIEVWPPIANLGTVGVDGYLIFQLFKAGFVIRFLKMFIFFVTFESVAAVISKYIFDYGLCTNFALGRGWEYSFCVPGVIFSSGSRLTGFGGEPAIFATYLALTIVLATWAQFGFSRKTTFFIVVVCSAASLISESTTGATLIFVALILIPFQRISFRGGPFLITMFSAGLYYLFNTKVLQLLSRKVIENKLKTNAGSVLDRNLNLGIEDYLRAWGKFPFGSQWNGNVLATSRGINLLADSLSYGPIVIILMFFLIVFTIASSKNYIQVLSTGVILFIAPLLIEPAWANSIWFVLLFTIACVSHSETKKSITQKVQDDE